MAAASLPPRGLGAAADRRWAVLGVAAAHVLAVWVLTQLETVRAVVREVLPVTVVLLGPDRPPTPRTVEIAPPPKALPQAAAPLVMPQVAVLAPTVPAPAAAVEAPAITPPAPAATPSPITATVLPPPPAPPSPPSPPPRKQVPATAVRYIVEPPFEVPRAARRAGEHGTVVLRVVVSAAGLPVQVSVQRSSGYPRLDEQAVWAMRQARFQPYTEDGRAIEVEALAPVEYPAE